VVLAAGCVQRVGGRREALLAAELVEQRGRVGEVGGGEWEQGDGLEAGVEVVEGVLLVGRQVIWRELGIIWKELVYEMFFFLLDLFLDLFELKWLFEYKIR